MTKTTEKMNGFSKEDAHKYTKLLLSKGYENIQ